MLIEVKLIKQYLMKRHFAQIRAETERKGFLMSKILDSGRFKKLIKWNLLYDLTETGTFKIEGVPDKNDTCLP